MVSSGVATVAVTQLRKILFPFANFLSGDWARCHGHRGLTGHTLSRLRNEFAFDKTKISGNLRANKDARRRKTAY
jgi:hypothetical protein